MKSTFLKYLFNHTISKIQVLLFLATLLGSIWYFQRNNESLSKQWSEWIDIVIALATLLVAISVWINEKIVDWKKSLPKKLNVQYKMGETTYASIKNAPLSGEDDIRAWGTSLAGTILTRDKINFSGFKIDGPKLDNNRQVMVYDLTVFLYEPMKVIVGDVQWDDNGNLISADLERIFKPDTVADAQINKRNSIM